MFERAGQWLIGLAILPLAAACGEGPFEAEPASWLQVTISSSASFDPVISYRGTGEFYWGNNPRTFSIYSRQVGTAEGEGFSLRLFRYTSEQPTPGRYPFALADHGAAVWSYYAGGFGRMHQGSLIEDFVATAGELVLTTVTSERVEGTFRFTARERLPNSQIDPNGRTITVEGSFVAGPAQPKKWQHMPFLPG